MNKCDVVCVSEHWLTDNQVELFVPDDYILADFMCRKVKKNGGVAIFVRHNIKFLKIDVSSYSSELNGEFSCIRLLDQNIIIISLYRSPNGDVNVFLENFELIMRKILKFKTNVAICGDYNIEMGGSDALISKIFSNLLRSLNLCCANISPTRGKACLDNIIVNFSSDFYSVSVSDECFADHNPILLKYHFKQMSNNNSPDINKPSPTWMRGQKEEYVQLFTDRLRNITWDFVYDFHVDQSTVGNLFDNFIKTYIDLWYSCSPLKRNCNRPKSKKLKWYTDELADIRENMLVLYKIYKNNHKCGTEEDDASYKAYLEIKKHYKAKLRLAKQLACEKYIEGAPNNYAR